MSRYYYANTISSFTNTDTETILGTLTASSLFPVTQNQSAAWVSQIQILRKILSQFSGHIIFEYVIPRIGKRVDCILLIKNIIFVIEFKIGSTKFDRYAIDQVESYALDLANFHEESHDKIIVPVLWASNAAATTPTLEFSFGNVSKPVLTNGTDILEIFNYGQELGIFNHQSWLNSNYKPTPTIIEAAQALYKNHSVYDITRSDAGAINLSKTSSAISKAINNSKRNNEKSICFITGVPGAGKTLAGLNFANSWHNPTNNEHAVFLSGNGPLVNVLREALVRDTLKTNKENSIIESRDHIQIKVNSFIQNIHHFRDDNIVTFQPIAEHVVIFDEAQRAWDADTTIKFMKKRGYNEFNKSEPEFLIGVLDRHEDWATIICLVGEGQEINTGEAGISEWLRAIKENFSHWKIYCSNDLIDRVSDSTITTSLQNIMNTNTDFHLSVSIRSFRSEQVSNYIGRILDANINLQNLTREICSVYPIKLTRSLNTAKNWLKNQARGHERYGIIASSGGIRLKSQGLHVKNNINPCDWFLNYKDDVRSSYYLEDVATEYDIQGLELDWACVAWDADLRFCDNNWEFKSFRGTKWQNINSGSAKRYLINSYRVILTRARQGMIIFIPNGSDSDITRSKEFYDGTYNYLISQGIEEV